MGNFFSSLRLLDASGYVIIAIIITVLVAGLAVNSWIRARYSDIEKDLKQHAQVNLPFRNPVLNQIAQDAEAASSRHSGEINTQVIIENHFQSELKAVLIGERFVKSSTGLLIILGLVGTFYGLTLSIGKLVTLVSGNASGVTEVAQALTSGLTEALSGMAVAFSTSLFGIVSAILMTLLGVFSNLTDRRTAVMAQIEAYLDNLVLGGVRGGEDAPDRERGGSLSGSLAMGKLDNLLGGFGQSVSQLENAVLHFDSALQSFATSTRDFREFNSHLKDNIQRMSLSFGDLSETLKTHVRALKSHEHS